MIRNTETNTAPIVFHAPGTQRKKLTWRSMRRHSFERIEHTNQHSSIPVPSYAIITWSNKPAGETCLEQSLAGWGIKPTSLPKKGVAPSTNPIFIVLRKKVKNWVNRKHKIDLTVEALKKLGVQYVIGLDAFDVVLTDHPDEIVRRFIAWPYLNPTTDGLPKVLFNASVVRWPQDEAMLKSCDEMERHIVEKRRHLNAGAWIASREYALAFWAEVQAVEMEPFRKGHRTSEQAAVRFIARSEAYFPDVQVDRNCVIFQHMTHAKLQIL